MRLALGLILTLALLTAAAKVLAVVIVSLIVLGLVFQPKDTLATLITLFTLGLFANHPLPMFALTGLALLTRPNQS